MRVLGLEPSAAIIFPFEAVEEIGDSIFKKANRASFHRRNPAGIIADEIQSRLKFEAASR